MRVLIACEESGVVRRAFRARGHSAYSCDLLPARDNSDYHFQGDVRKWLTPGQWDLLIAHPPCTYLTVAANRWQHDHWIRSKRGDRWHDGSRHRAERIKALQFVRDLMAAPVPRICIENPVSVISTFIRKPDQTVQPWQFWHLDEPGAGEVKRTCFWLKGLPPLVPTTPHETGRHPACWLMPPSPTRERDRSVTYRGIADAMATQWSFTYHDLIL